MELHLSPGSILDGQMRVIRLLGSGGVGSVYEVEMLRNGCEHLAVKFVHPSLTCHSEVLGRFHREAKAMAALDSPCVARIRESGEATTPAGVLPYIAMELMQGCTVAERMSRRLMSVSDVIKITIGTLEALEVVHAAGILHRDLKPENIFLARQSSGSEKVKLIDFGLSRILTDESLSRLTRPCYTVGTPFYMAPEQARAETVDHRIDIYSLGAVMYEMLTGRLPIDGPTYAVVMAKLLTCSPLPIQALRNELPVGLANAVMRALEKEAADRYATAAQFKSALLELDSEQTIAIG